MASYGNYKKIDPLDNTFEGLNEVVDEMLSDMLCNMQDLGVMPETMKIIIKNTGEYTTVGWRADE